MEFSLHGLYRDLENVLMDIGEIIYARMDPKNEWGENILIGAKCGDKKIEIQVSISALKEDKPDETL